ncbi:component of SufBCD complex [Sulfitobacter sp. D35]|uniref:component of SufBCD complex n=1 Tax=Sulfitobacter sp. D35 TaxID=3083252 RepID=UPI00296E5322|nr:component of SufBCD complex [Sulfitobacter sp. D35]MDW4497800.1 component of SufBCD complex [Sulfitobacter sp. D35]
MDWHQTLFELIDMRSFSNLWFWIALAVMWSTASHWVLGVPFDMIQRAGRKGGQAEADLEDLVRINTNRMLYIGEVSGLWLLGLGSFLLTMLAVLGFFYDVEIAQAVFLLFLPMSLVGLMSMRTARLLRAEDAHGAQLRRRLVRHRFFVQVIGMISIFVTAMWGMLQNLSIGALHG